MAKDRTNPKMLSLSKFLTRLCRHFPACCGILATVGATGVAFALQPTTPLANFARQGWVMENGLPQNTVQALVQGAGGFLWIGTEVGLARFDGNSFQFYDKDTSPALPGNDVRCLLASPDGALWIGTSDGLARLEKGTIRTFTTKDGLPSDGILALRSSGSGLLALTSNGWASLQQDRFVSAAPETASDSSALQAVLPGGLSAVAGKGAVELQHGTELMARLQVGKELPGSRIQVLFPDREGSLWIGTNSGLARWANGKVQTLPVTDSLASASILSLIEDREGDLWIGTEADGLHILRDQRFRTLTTRDGLSSDATTTVVEDRAGTLWVGTSGFGLDAITQAAKGTGLHVSRTWSVRDGLASDVILSLAAAPNGDLWVGTPDGLNRIHANTATSFTSADGLPDDFIRSLLIDNDGSLWIGTRRGLTHWIDPGAVASGTMDTLTVANGLGSNLVGALAKDGKGTLWVATFNGLSSLRNGKIENFTTANGLSSNVITALMPQADGTLLVGTQDHGWTTWNGKSFVVPESSEANATSVHAILEDGAKHLWFATGNGIARCDWSAGGRCRHWIEFGAADGLRGRETAVNSHPSAWRSRDGHLWFATPKGLVEVDPATFAINTVLPAVALERLAVDDTPVSLHASDGPIRIPAGHVHFEFDYAALSFVAPQKVRYRYKLDGFDHDWTDAGPRRTAYYTNIPPGSYTFRVQAANNDGVWNLGGAALEFQLRPHFYQTWWFYALLVLSLGGLVLLVQRLRLRRAEREFNAVLGERNRIAREIHDTLAQGYVGISVQLEVLAELLRGKKLEAAAKHLDLTRGYVREGLADARQSIWALRSQDSGETTLPVKLRRMVEAAGGSGLQTHFSLFGAYRPLPPGSEQEILRIAQEAIHNVKKHAEAANLYAQLEYAIDEVHIEIRDDGCGFAVSGSAPHGHYGLTGMRERAAVSKASLDIDSIPGSGTTIRLRVPAQRELQVTTKEQQ